MHDLSDAKSLLDEINEAVAGYDPVMKEAARDILIARAFGTVPRTGPSQPVAAPQADGGPQSSGGTSLGTLLEQWQPSTSAERVLLAVYSLTSGGAEAAPFDAVKDALNEAGIPVANLARAFESSMHARPPLARTTDLRRKKASSACAFHLTEAGAADVKSRLDRTLQT